MSTGLLYILLTRFNIVGYGDYFPTTFPGRVMAFSTFSMSIICIIVVCILGVLTTSLITVSIGNELSLEL